SSATRPCHAARNRNVPAATPALYGRSCSAVMMLSRPNGATNHGTPAYGTAPCGVSVSSICRSASDWSKSAENASLSVCRRALPGQGHAASFPVHAAHFEHVAKVGREDDLERHLTRQVVVTRDGE